MCVGGKEVEQAGPAEPESVPRMNGFQRPEGANPPSANHSARRQSQP